MARKELPIWLRQSPTFNRKHLEHSYKKFRFSIYEMQAAGWTVPDNDEGQKLFLKFLNKKASEALVQVVRPRNNSVEAATDLFIPDLVFARMDHIPASQFIGSMCPTSLNSWDMLSTLLSYDQDPRLPLCNFAAFNIVDRRMTKEMLDHRPLNEIFIDIQAYPFGYGGKISSTG